MEGYGVNDSRVESEWKTKRKRNKKKNENRKKKMSERSEVGRVSEK